MFLRGVSSIWKLCSWTNFGHYTGQKSQKVFNYMAKVNKKRREKLAVYYDFKRFQVTIAIEL